MPEMSRKEVIEVLKMFYYSLPQSRGKELNIKTGEYEENKVCQALRQVISDLEIVEV